MALAEATALEIRRRHEVFRAGLEGIEEYGIEVPPPEPQRQCLLPAAVRGGGCSSAPG